MRMIILALFFCLLLVGLVSAQENEPSPYEIALQRIEEARLSGATSLELAYLELTELPNEIGNLSQLQRLYLQGNQLKHLPPEIGKLVNLQELYLHSNQLRNLPAEIGNLGNLYWFTLASNRLTSLPSEIGHLSRLAIFSLSYNQLEDLPLEFAYLKQLYFLELSGNQFRYLPSSLSQLSELERYRMNCSVAGIPCGLHVDNNPLISPPPEVVEQGTGAILDYLRNEAWWHLQRLIAGGASGVGIVAAIVLGMRWRNRRRKGKKRFS